MGRELIGRRKILEGAGEVLKVISTMSVGYDHIDMEYCRDDQIAVG